MVVICPRKYQHPRIGGIGGCGRPAVVRGVWPLNNNYSIPIVQQRQQYSSLSHHTRRAVVGGFGGVLLHSALIWGRFAVSCSNLVPLCSVGCIKLLQFSFAAFCSDLVPMLIL